MIMDLKQMVKVATEMRKKHSFMLDISDMAEYEAAFITILVKNDGIYNFFVEVQDIPLGKIYVACKFFEFQEELRKMERRRHEKIR